MLSFLVAILLTTGALGKLNSALVSHGKLYWGAAVDPNTINIPEIAVILRSDFGQVTPENSMKWESTELVQGNFNFTGSDELVQWAISHGKLIRGHTLVWHNQLPSWVSAITDPDTLTSVIQTHISNVAGRYAGKLYAWDVCNEVLNEDGTLRPSVFFNVLGESFVKIAYEAARAADPHAKLYLNDYNLDSDNAKVRGIIALVKRINAGRKQLIDGLGTQMHLQAGATDGVRDAVKLLASTGLEVAITELDIADAPKEDYIAVTKACLATPACIGITTWGVADANSWRSDEQPLLFDINYQAKPAYRALIHLLKHRFLSRRNLYYTSS